MAYHDSDNRGAYKEHQWRLHTINRITAYRKYRWFSVMTTFVESLFLLFPLYFIIGFISPLFGRYGRHAKAWLLRQYFLRYFQNKGILKTFLTPPTPIPPGSLILTTRLLPQLSDIYYYHVFKTPVIIPASTKLQQFNGFPFLPFSAIGSLTKYISYPDGPLYQQQSTITDLLHQGHRVIAHINPDYLDPISHNHLYIDPLISELINAANATYMLTISDLHQYETATPLSPILATISLRTLSDVIGDDDPLSKESQLKIADFFHLKYASTYAHIPQKSDTR